MTQTIQDLGDGLILRRATVADTDMLAAFQGDVHREPGQEQAEEYVAAWTRDLMERPHPTFAPGDFTLVEDTHTGNVVSALCLISQTWSYGDIESPGSSPCPGGVAVAPRRSSEQQTWSYGGIEFGVGRPELVGTHPDYRRRGLVRAQFEVIHDWSAGRGEMVQAITGIPWYYRQFGYEMSMTLGGSRQGYKPQVPKLKDGEEELYHLRPATEADLPFIAEVYRRGSARYPVACVRDEARWRYELSGMSEKNVNRRALCIVEATDGKPVGFITHTTMLWRNGLRLRVYELQPGVSWLAVTPSVVRYLWALGEQWAAQDPKQEMETFVFALGAEHPAYQVFQDRLPRVHPPYAWYLRVPDLVGFVRHVAPVLERRLAGSALVGHSGKLQISYYRDGLQLVFEQGALKEVKPWQPTVEKGGDAAFPDLTFLQLLFGYRSLAELKYAFADCWTANDRARALLEALFPQQPSDVWPVS